MSRWLAIAVVALTGVVIVAMDWIPTPLNRNISTVDVAARLPSTVIHSSACAVACLAVYFGHRWACWLAAAWFTVVLTSAVLNWWVPYFAGAGPGEIDAQTFAEEYSSNLRVLPTWPGHPVVPDVQHMLIHGLLLASLVVTVMVAVSPTPLASGRGAFMHSHPSQLKLR
jgi:hypothetical protein